MRIQNQKIAEEASYAKKLAAAAAVELKNLANEVTKLSIENKKFEKESLASKDHAHRSSRVQTANGFSHKYSDPTLGRKSLSRSVSETTQLVSGDSKLDQEHFWNEVQERNRRETALEAELAEKNVLQDEYMKVLEQAKKREQSLENDLANMQVIVAKLKKQGTDSDTLCGTVMYSDERESDGDICLNYSKDSHEHTTEVLKEDLLDVRHKVSFITFKTECFYFFLSVVSP